MSKYVSLIRSRRFQTAAIGLIVVVASHFSIKLEAEELIAFSLIVSSWIWGDSIRETKEK